MRSASYFTSSTTVPAYPSFTPLACRPAIDYRAINWAPFDKHAIALISDVQTTFI